MENIDFRIRGEMSLRLHKKSCRKWDEQIDRFMGNSLHRELEDKFRASIRDMVVDLDDQIEQKFEQE